MKFRDFLTEGSKIIYKGTEDQVRKIMDALYKYNDENGYPYQDFMSYTKDYKKYMIEVDDVNEYKKHEKWIQKIIKGVK